MLVNDFSGALRSAVIIVFVGHGHLVGLFGAESAHLKYFHESINNWTEWLNKKMFYVTQVRSVHQRSLHVGIIHVVRELTLGVVGVWAAVPVHAANKKFA